MDIVNSQILQENISRILSIIGIKPSPLNESAAIIPFLLKKGDDLINFFTRDGAKKVGNDLLNKIKSGATDFTDSELRIILKNINSERVARQLMTSEGGLPMVKSFPITFDKAVVKIQEKVDEAIALARKENKSATETKEIINKTVNEYLQGYSNTWLNAILPNSEGKAFFNTLNDAGPEINDIAESFHQKMMQQFYDYIKINKPDWEKISLPKNTYSDSFRKMASVWTPNDIETIRRFIARRAFQIKSTQEKLQQEFIDVANEMGKEMAQGNIVSYYEKKLADILSVASSEKNFFKGAAKDMEILYEALAPKIPANVKQRLSREQIISGIVETLKKDNRLKNFDKIGNDLKGVLNQWKELLPFNFKDRKSSFWNRWFQFVLKGTPETFEEITATLRKKGLAETLARKVAAGIVAKYTVGPLLVGTMRTLYYIGQELYQGLDNMVDYDLPGGEGAPLDEKLIEDNSWFSALFNESFKEWTQTQPGLAKAWPWRTYIDNIIDFAKPFFYKVSSDEAHDNASERLTTPEERRLIDDFDNRRTGVSPTPSEESIPQDLLDSFDGELEYLKKRIYKTKNGLYALRFEPEGKQDVILINPGTGWSAVGKTESGIQRNLKLTDPITITGFLNSYPPTQFESVIKNTEKTLTEQLVVPDEPNPPTPNLEDPFVKDIEELENKIETIKNSQTAQKIKDSWDTLKNKIEDAAANTETQLKVWRLKQKIDAAASKVTPAGQTMNFVDCTGWNILGCKSESIKKVQSCMNLGVSGNFDEFLKSELARYKSTYAFREGFSDSDVQKICVFKQEEDRQEALKREQLAKQAQKAAEIQAFERNYPQKTTKATRRDEF